MPLYLIYRKIPNISPRLIDIFKHIFGGVTFRGDYTQRDFVLASAYEDIKIHDFFSKI